LVSEELNESRVIISRVEGSLKSSGNVPELIFASIIGHVGLRRGRNRLRVV
jgi:hypothetical protein